ncbi:MAG: hypothetical protein NT030_06900, partial [Candidatus Saganbacteria bacterium]|nr:hypothetical protein [Candidatus Saganbacteria bacterium]
LKINEDILLSATPDRSAILDFQKRLFSVPGCGFGDLPECPLKHSFADNCYVREIFIPKDMVIVGKIHKHSHPNFLLSGEVTVFTEEKGLQRLKGPLSMISSAGTKRVLYSHTDLVWVTVHYNPTNTKDIGQLEDEIIAKSYEEFESYCLENKSKLEALQ